MRSPHRAAVICCMGVLVLLAGCGAPQSSAKPAGTATPTVDAAMQAYVSVLRQYYTPYIVSAVEEVKACGDPVFSKDNSQLQGIFASCRPIEVSLMAAAQSVLDHLGTVSPPARWQTADGELKQALKAGITFSTALVHAMDANSTSQYVAVELHEGPPTAKLFCDPIAQFNAGPPPLDPPLGVPVANLCGQSD